VLEAVVRKQGVIFFVVMVNGLNAPRRKEEEAKKVSFVLAVGGLGIVIGDLVLLLLLLHNNTVYR
jgi:hypothetical protein